MCKTTTQLKSKGNSMNSSSLSEIITFYTSEKSHIIWDWNGTLLNDVQHAIDSMNSLLSEHDLPYLEKEKYKQIFEFPVRKYYMTLGFNFENESFENLCEKFTTRFMSGFKNLPLIPSMESILQDLHSQSKTQSVLSATIQPDLEDMIHHFELGSTFKYVFGIDNKLGGSKISRGRELLRISKIAPEKTVIIGDTLHDLEVAQDLGIDAILLAHGHQCARRLRMHHNIVIEIN